MRAFEYKARNRRGEAMSGTLEGENAEAIAEQLFRSSLTPIDIVPLERRGASKEIKLGWFKPKVTLDELVLLCRQLYTLQKAGVPILRSLGSLIDTTRNPTLAAALKGVSDDIQSGRELHMALARYPDIFSPLFISLIKVGESTGRVDETFLQLAGYLELEKETRNRIKSATRYPLTVILAIVVAMVIINIWVIPAFADAFARFDAELPIATQVLLGVSSFTLHWWPYLLAGTLVGLLSLRFWIMSEGGGYIWSRMILHIPLIGHILKKAILGRFSRSLALAMRSGVPLVQALTVISGVVNNAFVCERVLSMRDGIESGETIARTAAATGMFTSMVLQMIAIGEETGAVDDLLLETAEHYEREVKYDLARLSDAIEPVIIVIIGGMVLVLALGVFLPMWDLSSAVHKN
ncbi:MAG: type II secretion system F family protein [Sedimenticola sp.]|uniref:Type II secretion system F family protein n=1 Tax=Sedimenticola thiotaurini TaxID=1543721 RepID=A0A558CUH4_9GAMM|nr:type II secretion system F family protein [Sedimenticola sp.]TVT52419.1 MAG: type II secretion system F family protein [Sedimenticola thiotaurini]MCW8880948.1 type II secretion system F family protein [Sedimenticola sp.]MCW8921791.1 type II secretion system F family protein [Sedimenticola sp.]MCW8947819.1 type II secretion system F family protein [Sedimenticola sp.]